MRYWFLTLLVVIMGHGIAEARDRGAVRSMTVRDDDAAPTAAPAPTAPVIVQRPQPAQPPQPQPEPAATPQGPTGSGTPQIYVWKQGNVLHAVNNLSDVPPRYAVKVESADKNPRMNRMVAEGKKPGTAKATKQRKKTPSKNVNRKGAP